MTGKMKHERYTTDEQALRDAALRLLHANGNEAVIVDLEDGAVVVAGPRETVIALAAGGVVVHPATPTAVVDLPTEVDGINVHNDREIKHWMELLDITREDLVAAVGKVGPRASVIRAYFAEHRKRW